MQNTTNEALQVKINQSVAILIDGNNVEMSLQTLVKDKKALVDFCQCIPALQSCHMIIIMRCICCVIGTLRDNICEKQRMSVLILLMSLSATFVSISVKKSKNTRREHCISHGK